MRILFATAGPATAQENADYVINITKRLGASKGTIVNEWFSSNVKQKTKVPVLVIPNERSPE